MTTYCEDCEHVHNPKDPWYRWMCIKHKRVEGHGFVTKEVRETDPYLRCTDVNAGACPLFQRRKGPQLEMKT